MNFDNERENYYYYIDLRMTNYISRAFNFCKIKLIDRPSIRGNLKKTFSIRKILNNKIEIKSAIFFHGTKI